MARRKIQWVDICLQVDDLGSIPGILWDTQSPSGMVFECRIRIKLGVTVIPCPFWSNFLHYLLKSRELLASCCISSTLLKIFSSISLVPHLPIPWCILLLQLFHLPIFVSTEVTLRVMA